MWRSILDGYMATRDLPIFYDGVPRLLLFPPPRPHGQHGHALGHVRLGVALNATHALMSALSKVVAGPDGCVPEPLRVGRAAPSAPRSARAWAPLPERSGALAQPRCAPDRPGRTEEFYTGSCRPSLDVNGIASGSPDLVKTVLPVDARANVSIRLAPGQNVKDDERGVRAAGSRRAPGGAGARRSTSRTPPREPGVARPMRRRSALRARRSRRSSVRGRCSCRAGGPLPVVRGLVDRGIPTIATGFGSRANATCIAEREVPRRASCSVSSDARDVFTRLGAA